MHNFVYLAQQRSQEFSCEPNFFWGGACPPLDAPVLSLQQTVTDLSDQAVITTNFQWLRENYTSSIVYFSFPFQIRMMTLSWS